MSSSKKKRPPRSGSRKRPSRRTGKRAQKRVRKKRRSLIWRILRPFSALLFPFPLIALLFLSLHLYQLHQRVTARFEGRRWELPARVYARPLELYLGRALTASQFETELKALDYLTPYNASQPGSWTRLGDGRYRLVTRAFEFWDGVEEATPIEVMIQNNQITSLRHLRTGSAVTLVRLDPALIASIYPQHQEDRILVSLDDLSPSLLKGVVAVEDRRFYRHHGLDPRGVARAMWSNLKARRWVQGGSTLSQQLVKNFYLTPDRSLWRKANEAIMALILEHHYSKEEILETYFNEIYMGQSGAQSIHGMGLASHFYFGKELTHLSLAQEALLIGMIRGPSHYNPRQFPERALSLRNLILRLWHEQNLIDEPTLNQALNEPLGVIPKAPQGSSRYPAFLDLVRRQLREDYREEDLRSEGLRIFTTLAPGVQQLAERAMSERIRKFGQPDLQGAFVILKSSTGEVIALSGGREMGFAGFNRALDSQRPIGSLIKPLIFLEALSMPERFTLLTTLEDSPLTLPDPQRGEWTPQNFDRNFRGELSLLDAITHSVNVPSVGLGLEVGLERLIAQLQAMGVSRSIPPYPSLFLGALDLSPFEVAQMYQTLASEGFLTPLRAIREVQDANAQPLNRYPIKVEQLANPEAVFLLDYALQNVMKSGTGRALYRNSPKTFNVAGKTGTTNDYRDSWFAGYADDTLGVVWLGRDDNRPIGLTGSSGALRVWGEMMGELPIQSWSKEQPESIEWHWVDPVSRTFVNRPISGAVQLPFICGSTPSERHGCPEPKRAEEGGWFKWLRGSFR